LDKVEPWNVDVGRLIGSFLQEMKLLGDIDFRISGSALYSASVIFMKKTRELVQLGILPPEQEGDDEELVIPLIRPPFRLSNRRVTLEELLVAMDRVLTKGVRSRPSPRSRASTIRSGPSSIKMEIDEATVEEIISEIYADLNGMMKINEVSRFVDILMNNSRTEIVRTFFALLHLFGRGYVDIWMDDEEIIWVKLLSPPEESEERLVEVQTKLKG
jgi:chromatin segregation and condensation protein Rec8/ScpA/Scc1 (kleisin family)